MYVGPSLYQYGISFFPPRKMLGNISYISIFLVVSHPIFGQTQLLHVGYIYIYTVYIYISRYNITVFYTNNNYELFPWWKTDGFTIQGPPCYPWTESFPRSLNELLVGFPVEIPGDLNNFYSPTLRCPNLPFLDYIKLYPY